MKAKFELVDALERLQEADSNFEMPGPSEIEEIEKGDFVKLIFKISHPDEKGNVVESFERMWVVVETSEFPFFSGILDNDPYCTEEIKSGVLVKFAANNIIDIMTE